MATTPKHTWYKIAQSITEINFTENGMATLTVSGKTITVALHKNQIFACTQKCPHAGGILADGYLDALGNIVCPMHRYKFDLKNGRNVSGEGYFLKTFCVEERTDGVFIKLDNTAFFEQ